MKGIYYFPHDFHSRKDPKCSALINDFGLAGYGIYWAIVEILHEQGGKLRKFPKLIEGIAFELRMEKEALTKQIEAMLHDYNLLQEDDNFIWTDRVLENIQNRELKYKIKAEAGRAGGIKSGEIRKKRSETKQCFNQTKQNEQNKIKENNNTIAKKPENPLSSHDDGDSINKIFNILYQINPLLNYGNKTQRNAAERIIKRVGEEKAINAATFAVKVQGEQFAPTITTPLELEKKYGQLKTFQEKKQKEQPKHNPLLYDE